MTYKIDRAVIHRIVVLEIKEVVGVEMINPEQRFADFMFVEDFKDICNRVRKDITDLIECDISFEKCSVVDNVVTFTQKVFEEIHQE